MAPFIMTQRSIAPPLLVIAHSSFSQSFSYWINVATITFSVGVWATTLCGYLLDPHLHVRHKVLQQIRLQLPPNLTEAPYQTYFQLNYPIPVDRCMKNCEASSIDCNFSSFQYFLMILDAFDAETTGAFNAPKNIKNGSVVQKLSPKNLGVSNEVWDTV